MWWFIRFFIVLGLIRRCQAALDWPVQVISKSLLSCILVCALYTEVIFCIFSEKTPQFSFPSELHCDMFLLTVVYHLSVSPAAPNIYFRPNVDYSVLIPNKCTILSSEWCLLIRWIRKLFSLYKKTWAQTGRLKLLRDELSHFEFRFFLMFTLWWLAIYRLIHSQC